MESSVEQHPGVTVPAGPVRLRGDLTIPDGARGVVVLVGWDDRSGDDLRERALAKVLDDAGLATLLVDLLTPDERVIDEATQELRFHVGLLAERLIGATRWLARHDKTADLSVGYLAASIDVATALVAAAELPDVVGAVVGGGGRPDLAGRALEHVRAATLLIVGSIGERIIELNRQAAEQLQGDKRLVILPGVSQRLDEPRALDAVARLARDWFERYLARELRGAVPVSSTDI